MAASTFRKKIHKKKTNHVKNSESFTQIWKIEKKYGFKNLRNKQNVDLKIWELRKRGFQNLRNKKNAIYKIWEITKTRIWKIKKTWF